MKCNGCVNCPNCRNHFMELVPNVKEIIISKHFKRDLKDKKGMDDIVKNITDLNHAYFSELHKYEENIDGIPIFRAKKDAVHFVFAINREKIIFLRAFKNFKEYEKFLENQKKILKILKQN